MFLVEEYFQLRHRNGKKYHAQDKFCCSQWDEEISETLRGDISGQMIQIGMCLNYYNVLDCLFPEIKG